MEKSLKRKRDEDEASLPRITYNAGERTFDRLLKAGNLEEMKEVVRQKLGYSRDIAIQLTQLRDGKGVDLEDEEDFEAFYSAARVLHVVTVQVTTASSTHRETSRVPFELPNAPASEEAIKKRKKKRKLNDVTKDDEPVENAEKKRKTVVSVGNPEPEALPPKKKKKQDAEAAAPGQNLAPPKEPSADSTKTAPAPPKAKQPAPIVVQEPVPDQPPTPATLEPAKKKKKAAVIDKAPAKVLSDPPKTVEADIPKPAEDNQETTDKSKKQAMKKRKKTAEEEGGPEKASLEEGSKAKAGAKKTKTATVAVNGAEGEESSDGGVVYVNRAPQQKGVAPKEPVLATSSALEKPSKANPVSTKKKVAPKTVVLEPPSAVNAVSAATKGDNPNAQEESESSKEAEEEESGSEADKANDKEKVAEKEKEKVAEKDRERAVVKGREKAAEKTAEKEKEKGTKVKAKEKESRPLARASVGPPVLNTQTRAEELAALITMAGERGAQRKSRANRPAPQPATTEKPSGDAKTPDPKSKSTTRKLLSKAPARTSEPKSSAGEETEKPEERKPRASRSKLQWPVPDQCPYCLRQPRHVKSRCTFIRSSGTKGLQDRLVILEEDPDIDESTRKAFVEEIKELIAAKEEKERSSSAKVVVKPAGLPAKSNASSAPPSEAPLVPDDNASPPRDSSPDEPLAIPNLRPSVINKTKVVTPAPPKPHALFTAIEGVSSRLSASADITDKQLPAGHKPAASPLFERHLIKQKQSTSATAPQPKSKPTISVIQQKTKPAASENKSPSTSSSNESAPFATLAAPSISASLVGTASFEEQLDVIVRGPSARIRVAEIASSESDEAEEEEGLLEEEVEKKEPPISKAKRFAAVNDSSDDDDESEVSIGEEDVPAVPSPHRVTSSRLPLTESPEASGGKPDNKSNHAGERSFHDVNELASSMEDDRAGDRAFSEALAEDTAIFRMVVDDAGTSPKTTSGDNSDESDNDEEGRESASSSSSSSEEESRAVTPVKRSPQHRKDDIEEFETPKRADASPIVELNFAKTVQSTPRVIDRMRTHSGKTPLPTPQRAASSHDKAMNLLERVKQSQSQTAGKRALPARATRSSSRVQSDSLPHPPSTPATRKGKATATVLSEVTETKDQDQDQEHERGDARLITETPMSLDTWTVLKDDITMVDGEVTTMVDELESTNEHEVSVHFSSQSNQGQSSSQQALFIESETQQSFPYSQWTSNKPSSHESDDESDEEQEVELAIKQPGPSIQRQSQSFRRLTDIASQDISFHANMPSVALHPTNYANKQKATEKELFGSATSSDSETSDSDSESDDDDKKISHIPKSRRAGAVSSKP